jgi:uncharacterized protein YgiB involved in biofilm formation
MPSGTVKVAGGLLFLVAAGAGLFWKFHRTPACSGDGQLMSTLNECQSWGVNAEICKDALAKAKEAATRAAPRSESSIQCEVRFSDCFEAPEGGFYPRPSFCLRPAQTGAQPNEIRYLEYESDRLNRKKTREIRIN